MRAMSSIIDVTRAGAHFVQDFTVPGLLLPGSPVLHTDVDYRSNTPLIFSEP